MLTSKMNSTSKAVAGFLNALTDFSIQDGFQSGFNNSKDYGKILLDGIFEGFKFGAGELGDATGASKTSQNGADALIDQMQTWANNMVDDAQKAESNGTKKKD